MGRMYRTPQPGMIRLDLPLVVDDPEGRPGLYAAHCLRCDREHPEYRRAYGRDKAGMGEWLTDHLARYHRG